MDPYMVEGLDVELHHIGIKNQQRPPVYDQVVQYIRQP